MRIDTEASPKKILTAIGLNAPSRPEGGWTGSGGTDRMTSLGLEVVLGLGWIFFF